MPRSAAPPKFPFTPGLLGGVGPFAHVWFERRLLELARERYGAAADADFPAWVLVSMTRTPDRTAALAGGPSPVPALAAALAKLAAAGADFAAIACNTLHAFLPDLATRLPLPVVHAVTETADAVARDLPDVRTVGLLATTGTCRSGIFASAFAARGIRVVSPPDAQQESLVMAAIYGPTRDGRRGGGIKGGLLDEPGPGGMPAPRQLLLEAATSLIGHDGADAVLVACSEISLAVRPGDLPRPVVDTMDVLAEQTLALAAGARPLDSIADASAWPTPATR